MRQLAWSTQCRTGYRDRPFHGGSRTTRDHLAHYLRKMITRSSRTLVSEDRLVQWALLVVVKTSIVSGLSHQVRCPWCGQ